MAYDALLVDLPLAVFLSGALVVVLLALGECYLTLHQMAFPIQFHGDTGMALLVHGGEKLRQLLAVQEEFFYARGVGDDMRARRVQRRDLAAEKEGFAIF